MLIDESGRLSFRGEELLENVADRIDFCSLETHSAVVEVETTPQATVADAVAALGGVRNLPDRAARGPRPPSRRRRDPSPRHMGRDAGPRAGPLPEGARDDARARAPRADHGDARAHRRSRVRRRRSLRSTALVSACRSSSRSRPTRRSGRRATPGSRQRARRSSAPFREPACLRTSPPTRTGPSASTSSSAPARSPSRPSCGGTRGCSRGSARSRSASPTPSRAWRTWPPWSR